MDTTLDIHYDETIEGELRLNLEGINIPPESLVWVSVPKPCDATAPDNNHGKDSLGESPVQKGLPPRGP